MSKGDFLAAVNLMSRCFVIWSGFSRLLSFFPFLFSSSVMNVFLKDKQPDQSTKIIYRDSLTKYLARGWFQPLRSL